MSRIDVVVWPATRPVVASDSIAASSTAAVEQFGTAIFRGDLSRPSVRDPLQVVAAPPLGRHFQAHVHT